jgi:hypothetical protein
MVGQHTLGRPHGLSIHCPLPGQLPSAPAAATDKTLPSTSAKACPVFNTANTAVTEQPLAHPAAQPDMGCACVEWLQQNAASWQQGWHPCNGRLLLLMSSRACKARCKHVRSQNMPAMLARQLPKLHCRRCCSRRCCCAIAACPLSA